MQGGAWCGCVDPPARRIQGLAQRTWPPPHLRCVSSCCSPAGDWHARLARPEGPQASLMLAFGVQCKPYNLLETKVIRDLNPADVDSLISVSGMVTRTSNVIPDLRCCPGAAGSGSGLSQLHMHAWGPSLDTPGQPRGRWGAAVLHAGLLSGPAQPDQVHTARSQAAAQRDAQVRRSQPAAQAGAVQVPAVRERSHCAQRQGPGVRAHAVPGRELPRAVLLLPGAQPLRVCQQADHQDAGAPPGRAGLPEECALPGSLCCLAGAACVAVLQPRAVAGQGSGAGYQTKLHTRRLSLADAGRRRRTPSLRGRRRTRSPCCALRT